MSLPQELVDEILSYLSSDDEHGDWSLRNCSLVAKSWINPSRRYIFETVTIRERTFRSWLANIPPTNDGLLQHVCSLSLSFQSDNGFYIPPPVRRTDVLRDYFPSFYQLRHLSLSFIHLPSSISQQVDTFSAFRHTLSRLSLDDCKITTNALGTLLDYFPNLNRLDLSRIRHEVDAELAPPVSCPLVGRLCVSDLYWDNMGFFDQLSGLGLVFEEIIFNDCPFARPRFIGRVFSTVGVSAKRLRLLEPLQPGDWSHGATTLPRCRELLEIEIPVIFPGPEEAYFVSSFNSANVRKVTFVDKSSSWDGDYLWWEILDEPLRQLADQLGSKRVLEVDFRTADTGVVAAEKRKTEMHIVNSLVTFREKGRLRITRVCSDGSERVVYSSDRVV